MNVAAIMPCRGRAEQTVRNVRRLLATAGLQYGQDWGLVCAIDGDEVVQLALAQAVESRQIECAIDFIRPEHGRKAGYWYALQRTMQRINAPLIANLANDLLPGHQWLGRAVAAYQQTFGDGLGMVGFNDGHHETGHSCHFLIHRKLIERYGGWPVWYDHAYGDTELCQRAIADDLYVKAPWATLFHDHPYFGGQDDAVYAEGRAKADRDHQLYEWRKARGWPAAHP